MESKAEQHACRLLRAILDDLPKDALILDSEQFQDALGALEFLIPEVLGELHPEWKHESLDGIIPITARMSGERQVDVFGLCIVISDQSLAPIHLRLQVSSVSDKISWLECKLGERGENGMVRTPYNSLKQASKRLHALGGKAGTIDWVYEVTFGQRQPQ